MGRFKIMGICARDVNGIMSKLRLRGLSVYTLASELGKEKKTITVSDENLDLFDLDLASITEKIQHVLYSSDYSYEWFFDESECKYIYKCNKKYDSYTDRYMRDRYISQMNSFYGAYVDTDTAALRQAFIRINDKSFKMYGGIERATGKFKTTVVWGDGHKETVTATKQIKGYTPVMIFAYAFAKKKFRTNSHFKKYVDNHTEEFGEFYIFYDEATYRQATAKKTDKKYDIYDMAALSIAIREYGSLKKLEERVEEATK